MKKSEYYEIIDKHLKPVLLDHGFEKIMLKGCMSEEVLYRRNRLWFGTSWDWRDRYLEIDLGHLYWFKDVMPRFIVLGNYSSYSNDVKRIPENDKNYLTKVATTIAKTMPSALSIYEERYNEILSSQISKRSKYTAIFLNHLGNEVKDEELPEFLT